MVLPPKRRRKQNKKQSRDHELSLGPVKFEAFMEPSENIHGVIGPFVFEAQVAGLSGNVD